MAAVARAVRKKAWPLQPFAPLELGLSGRTALKTLSWAEPAGAPLRLAGRKLYCGLYLNELLVRMLHPGDPHPGLHGSYAEALQGLATEAAPEPILRRFELDALDECGYGLPLERDLDGAPLQADALYHFLPGDGFCRAADGLHSGRHLCAIRHRQLQGERCLRSAKTIIRQALTQVPGAQNLRSRELWQ